MNDILFVALRKSQNRFEEKLSSGKKTSDKDMFALSWTVDELGRLNSDGRDMYVEVISLGALLKDDSADLIQANLARMLSALQSKCLSFRGVSRHTRNAATHMLVTMISSSKRNKKPYALPICCIPYKGLSESAARSHINQVINKMKDRNMKVAGKLCILLLYVYVQTDLHV